MIYANKTSYFASFSYFKRLILQFFGVQNALFCAFPFSKLHKIASFLYSKLHKIITYCSFILCYGMM